MPTTIILKVVKRGLYRVFWDTRYWPIFKGILGYLCFFLFWDMGYSGFLGYEILKFILGYELN